jgi:histidinol-phosphate aminotransferase
MIEKMAPSRLQDVKPYIPGKPVEEVERELGIKNAIKLASNENPLGPSKKAVSAIIRCTKKIHMYPDGGCYYLRRALSEKLGVKESQIVFGTGSNEIIELIVKVFGQGRAVIGNHSFLIYRIILKVYGAQIVEVPFKGYEYDVERIIEELKNKPLLLFIDTPNNPTGSIIRKKDLSRIIDALHPETLLVLDEAYHEFVVSKDYLSGIHFVKEGLENIVVLRTFSKAYGLAGLRIGYGITSEVVAELLNKVRQPFNVTIPAQEAALAALKDEKHVQRSVELSEKAKRYLYKKLDEMGLEYNPSYANFVLIKVGNGREVFEKLLRRGIIVREMSAYGFPEHIRVSVGKMKEMEKFVKELKEVLK